MNEIKGDKKYFFGTVKDSDEKIYFSKPTWDCNWYWGFGYLGNKNIHYHLDGYASKDRHIEDKDGKFHFITESRNKNMYDCLLEDYELNPLIKDNLWTFCELVGTIYTLKETAEVLGRGGSHYTTNPCAELIKNVKEVKRINEKVLPELMQTLINMFK